MANTINQKALDLLQEAALTSSLVKKDERASGVVDEEHMYPTTKAETDRMDDLLNQAQAAVEDPNEETFREKYEQLDAIVDWSYGRYRTWTWGLVIAVLLFAAILFYIRHQQIKKADEYKAVAAQIEAWTPCDTTITWEKCATEGRNYDKRYTTANQWKAYELSIKKYEYERYEKNIKDYAHSADTASTAEAKEKYLKSKQYSIEQAEKYKHDFDSLASLDFEGVQQMALNNALKSASGAKSDSHFFLFNMILLLILIALYIWTGYVYGYDLTRHTTRDKIFGWLRKATFWLAGVFFGTGFLMQLFAPDSIVKNLATGQTRRETDLGGTFLNIVFKLGLMAIGAAIFIFISTFLMFIETVFGLATKIRNLIRNKKTAPTAPVAAE